MRGLRREFGSYLAVSAFAFTIDLCILLLLAGHIHYLLAATAGFLAGAFVHYLLAVKLVFAHRRLENRKYLEILIYMTTGLLGVLVNLLVIYLGVEWLHISLMLAKFLAAGSSLVTGYATRKLMLFRAHAGEQEVAH